MQCYTNDNVLYITMVIGINCGMLSSQLTYRYLMMVLKVLDQWSCMKDLMSIILIQKVISLH